MKTKTFLLAVALMLGTQCVMAQTETAATDEPQRPTPEQMNKMMATEASNQLMLNEATSAKFIPIYENYLKAMEELRAKYADKACCGPRPDGPRPDGMRDGRHHGRKDEARDGRRGPRPDDKNAPRPDDKKGPRPDDKNAPKPDGKDAPKACSQEGGACCGPKVLTDEEVEKRVKDRIAMMREEADIQEKYYKELRAILTPLQTVRVLDFKK
jgi:hypothetical protein